MRRTPSIQYGWKSMADQTCEQFTDGCLDRDLAEWIGDDLADLVLGQLIGDDHADLVCAYGEAITEGDAEVGPGGFAAFLSSLEGDLWATVADALHSTCPVIRRATDDLIEHRADPRNWPCWEPEHADDWIPRGTFDRAYV